MIKNTSGQSIGAQMVTASDGSAFTSSVTVYVTGDNGTQAIGSVGSGVCTHEGNGYHSYAPSQAETNYDHIAFTFIGTGAIPSSIQVFTKAGDAFTRLGAPAGASVSADIATIDGNVDAIKLKTDDLTFSVSNVLDCNIEYINGGSTGATTLDRWMRCFHNDDLSSNGTTTTCINSNLTQADDYWNGMMICFRSGANTGLGRLIVDFDAASDTLTVSPAFPSATGSGDDYVILPADFLGALQYYDAPTKAELDVVEGKIDTIDTNVDAILVDTNDLQTNQGDWVTATGFSTHSASDVWSVGARTVTGGTIDTNNDMRGTDGALLAASYTAPDNSSISAILTDTGTTIPAQISGLNNLSAAQVNAEVDTALADYDAPTKAELDAVEAKIDTIDGVVDGIVTDIAGLNNISASDILDGLIEPSMTLTESIRLQNAVLLGKVSGAGSGTETFRDINDTKDRVTATVDVDGNRTAITLNDT